MNAIPDSFKFYIDNVWCDSGRISRSATSLPLKICLIPACIDLMRKPAVNVRNLAGQEGYIIYHCVMNHSVKMGQVVARFTDNGYRTG